ncbi:MAG: TIR domain-containing protein [Mycobacterium sp.]
MTSPGIATATAFWSYAHSDDDGTNGKIRRLKEGVDHAFKRYSGDPLASFFDRSGDNRLVWGDEWRSKISSTIWGTTFFIPVISPSYLKSSMCRDEFNEFWEKAEKSDDLQELLLPILWAPVHPATKEENQVWDIVKGRQYLDWTQVRKLGEDSPEYERLVDEMGERLAEAARTVANVSEGESAAEEDGTDSDDDDGGAAVPVDSPEPPPTDPGPAGLVDLADDATEQAKRFAADLTTGFQALQEMQTQVLAPDPLHPNASTGQRLFYFKRISKDMGPYVQKFEQSLKEAEDEARRLNDTMFKFIDILQDPVLRRVADIENMNVSQVRGLPALLAEKFGDYGQFRDQISAIGRMSRDLSVPMSSIDRGFDSMDTIMELVQDWTTAMEALGDDPDATPMQ